MRALEAGEHAIVVDGIEMCYHVHGQGSICVMHPGGPGLDWSYLRMPSVEARFQVIYVEPIGTGGSGRLPGHPRGYGIDRDVGQLAGFLEFLDLDDVILLGHSYGGLVVQAYALSHPGRVGGLVLYSTTPTNAPEVWAEAGARVAAFAQRFPGDRDAEDVLPAWRAIPKIGDDVECTRILRSVLPVYFADHRSVESGFHALRSTISAVKLIGDGAPFDVRSALPALTVPSLVIAGAHDFLFGPKWADLLVGGLPRATRVLFERSGHFAHLEEPVAFAEAISTWAEDI